MQNRMPGIKFICDNCLEVFPISRLGHIYPYHLPAGSPRYTPVNTLWCHSCVSHPV